MPKYKCNDCGIERYNIIPKQYCDECLEKAKQSGIGLYDKQER